jgi:allantoinase
MITAIANGTIATDYGVFDAHVVIKDGRISHLTDDDGVLRSADEVIDARGLTVLPGAIDPHAHFEDPGHTEREDFCTGTMSAAAGGITTVVEHPLTYPPVVNVERLREKIAIVRAKAVVDVALWAGLVPDSVPLLRAMFDEGASGFKAFMPFSEPDYPNCDDGALLDGMAEIRAFGGLLLVHAESDSLLRHNIGRLQAAGRHDVMAHAESRPPIVEEEAVHRLLFLAERAGVRLQVVHVSCPGSAHLIKEARSRGLRVTMEVCPHHLTLDLEDLRRLGPYGRCAPCLTDRSLVEGMWGHVLDGTVDCLVSDHCAYTIAEKEAGWDDIFAAPLGCQVMQETVPVVLSQAIHERGMPLDAFVRFSSSNAARVLGIYPRKGTIRVGSDADLALWDLDKEWRVDPARQFSKNPWSPFEGMKVRGQVVRTLVRGTTVYHDGEIRVAPGYGNFLHSQEIRAGRASATVV